MLLPCWVEGAERRDPLTETKTNPKLTRVDVDIPADAQAKR